MASKPQDGERAETVALDNTVRAAQRSAWFVGAIASEALDATEAAQCELFVEARELQDRVERQQVLDAAARVAFNAHEAAAEAPEAPEVRRATISPPRASARTRSATPARTRATPPSDPQFCHSLLQTAAVTTAVDGSAPSTLAIATPIEAEGCPAAKKARLTCATDSEEKAAEVVTMSGFKGRDLHIRGLMGNYSRVKGGESDGCSIFQLVDDEGEPQGMYLKRSATNHHWMVASASALERDLCFIISCYASSDSPIQDSEGYSVSFKILASIGEKNETEYKWIFDPSITVMTFESAAEKSTRRNVAFAAGALNRQRLAAWRRHAYFDELERMQSRAFNTKEVRASRLLGVAPNLAVSVLLGVAPGLDMIAQMVTVRDLGSLLTTCEEIASASELVWSLAASGPKIIGHHVHTRCIPIGAELGSVDARRLRQIKFWKEGTVRAESAFGDVTILSGGRNMFTDMLTGAHQGLSRAELEQLGPFRKQTLEHRACMLAQPNARATCGRDGRMVSIVVPSEAPPSSTPLDVVAARAVEMAWLAAAAASHAANSATNMSVSTVRRQDWDAHVLLNKAFDARNTLGSTPPIPLSYLVAHQGVYKHGLRVFDFEADEWFGLFAWKRPPSTDPGQDLSSSIKGELWSDPIQVLPTEVELDALRELFDYDFSDPKTSAIRNHLVEARRTLEPIGPLGSQSFVYDSDERESGPCGAIYGMAWLPRIKRLAVGFQDGLSDVVLVDLDTRKVTQELEVAGCCQVVHALPAPWACATSGCGTLQVWGPIAGDHHTQLELVHTLSGPQAEGKGSVNGVITVLHGAALILEIDDSQPRVRVFTVDPLELVRFIEVAPADEPYLKKSTVSGLVDVGGRLFAGCVVSIVDDVRSCDIRIWDAGDGTMVRRFGAFHPSERRLQWCAPTLRNSWKVTSANKSIGGYTVPLLLWNEASETLLAEHYPKTKWAAAEDKFCVWPPNNARRLEVVFSNPVDSLWVTLEVSGTEPMREIIRRYLTQLGCWTRSGEDVVIWAQKHMLFTIGGVRVWGDDTPDSLNLSDAHSITATAKWHSTARAQTVQFGRSFAQLRKRVDHTPFASSVADYNEKRTQRNALVTLDGRRHFARIMPQCVVKQIRDLAVHVFEHISDANHVRIFVNGVELKDDSKTLEQCGIKSDDTIHIAEPTRVHVPSRIESWNITTGDCVDVCVGLGDDELPCVDDFGAGFTNPELRVKAPLVNRERWMLRALPDGSLLTLGNGGEFQRWM